MDSDADWTRVEDALGLSLPRDFIEIARRYGRGAFCGEFSCRTPEQMIEENPGRLEDGPLARVA
ncbi:hypothetical protein [Actinomadura welshii]|uniref:hypothetical protein n=1 Tax=Actinomadura welshii TaxID=3103817 RepID=UPI001268624F|nr:hypothetical protein [Actinomadura madurae]